MRSTPSSLRPIPRYTLKDFVFHVNFPPPLNTHYPTQYNNTKRTMGAACSGVQIHPLLRRQDTMSIPEFAAFKAESMGSPLSYPPSETPTIQRMNGAFTLEISGATDLPEFTGHPYCVAYDCRGKEVFRSRGTKKAVDPAWSAVSKEISIPDSYCLLFRVYRGVRSQRGDFDDDILGEALFCGANGMRELIGDARVFQGELDLHDINTRTRLVGRLGITITNRTIAQQPLPARFPNHAANRVTLYQSAHVGDELRATLPRLPNEFIREDCFEDVLKRLAHSEHFIYIMGTQIDFGISLLREKGVSATGFGDATTETTLCEILLKKASDGVKIAVFVDDVVGDTEGKQYLALTQHPNISIYEAHLRATNDPFLKQHQTSIICDCLTYAKIKNGSQVSSPPAPGAKRSICAFTGGIDLSTGRWDTPAKELFATLRKEHAKDYYNSISKGVGYAPRQPWQDVHCQLEGPAAFDMVQNFERRWMSWVLSEQCVEGLYDMNTTEASDAFLTQTESIVDDGSAQWNVQVLRSVNATHDNTIEGIEADCHTAYCATIEASQRFVYIESHLFVGTKCGSTANRIPAVLLKRIVSAIEAKQEYAVYIVLPLYPDGGPKNQINQEILFHQHRTVQFMYNGIAAAIKRMGGSALPTDYLNFYTLGKRQVPEGRGFAAGATGDLGKYMCSGRMPITVQSQILVADDEVLIIGSSDVNERGMSGQHNAELCVRMSQPEKKSKGDVHAFRLSLWSEHLTLKTPNPIPSIYFRPESAECVRQLNSIASAAWAAHQSANQRQDGHLMTYPYTISHSGHVKGKSSFPGFTGTQVSGKDCRQAPECLLR